MQIITSKRSLSLSDLQGGWWGGVALFSLADPNLLPATPDSIKVESGSNISFQVNRKAPINRVGKKGARHASSNFPIKRQLVAAAPQTLTPPTCSQFYLTVEHVTGC